MTTFGTAWLIGWRMPVVAMVLVVVGGGGGLGLTSAMPVRRSGRWP
jgi:hypothetical protein